MGLNSNEIEKFCNGIVYFLLASCVAGAALLEKFPDDVFDFF